MNENEMNVQAPEMEEPVVVTKPKSKKGLWIGAAAALVAIAIIVVAVIGIFSSSPLGLIGTGFRNSLEAMEDDAYTKLMDQVSNGGSVEVSADFDSLSLQGTRIPLNGTCSVKVYTNTEEQKTAMTLGVEVAGQKLDASIFANQESVAIASDCLLGDMAYGFKLENFVKNFNNSVFGPNGAYSLGIELPEDLQTQLDLDQYQNYEQDTEKIAAQMAAQFVKTLEANSTVEKENASLTLGGDEVKTTAVIIKIDSNQLAAIIEEMLEYLRTDAEFKAFVEEYEDIIFAEEISGVTEAGATAEEFFQVLDEAAEDMDKLKQEILDEEAGVDATFHITKSGKQLVGMELLLASNIEPGKMTIFAGPDLNNAKEIRFEVGSGDEIIQGTYLVKVDDENTFMMLLDMNENDRTVLKTDVRWDKQTGAWEITLTDDSDETAVIRGTLEQSDKELSVVLETVETGGEKAEQRIGVVLRTEDTMPEMPHYNDLLTMTAADVESLVNDLGTVLLQLMYGMG